MKYLAIFALSLGLSACASTTPEKLKGAEHYFSEGQKAMGKNRCIEATEQFQRLVSNFPGSQRVAEAQFMLAEAYFCSEDWVNAAFEYQRIVDIYPSSEWVTESQFKIGEAYFRQLRRAELDQKRAEAETAALEQDLELPITSRLFSILFEGEDPRASVGELMSRPARSERDPHPC